MVIVGNFSINSYSLLAVGMAEIIPVDMQSEVIPFAVSFVSLSVREPDSGNGIQNLLQESEFSYVFV